ncbi:MAG: TraB/GumN family protein [Erythrobacter sp.]
MVDSTNATRLPKFLAALLLSSALLACGAPQIKTAEVQTAPGPALWTLADEDTTIHLFGFAPVLKNGTEWQNSAIRTAFDAADLIVVETDSSAPEAQQAVQAAIPQIGIFTDGRTLSSTLSEGDRDEVNAITTNLGVPLQALDTLKPWLASVQLGVVAIQSGGYDLANPPATQLITRAKNGGKTIQILEQPVELMNLMARFDENEQNGMFVHAARSLRDAPDRQNEIAEAWLTGDVEEVGNLLHGADGAWSSRTIYDALLVRRNEAWAQEINRLLDSHQGTVFFTVGLGHFAGEDSLIAMLEAADLEVTRR